MSDAHGGVCEGPPSSLEAPLPRQGERGSNLQDRAKGGFVANTRFRQILDFHKIYLSDREFELLCRR